jgi:NAD(P)-dependent dehydrogenase (short-subunit alcohol dehydrogenase family)
MLLDLANRVAIVTGGSSGIGYAIAKVLAQEGAQVVITARRTDLLRKAAASLTTDTGRTVTPIDTDTTDQARVDQMVAAVHNQFSRVDILVNCAAIPGALASNRIEELDDGALLRDLNTKVVGYARCCKATAPFMKQRSWGRIINIGGLTAREPQALGGLRNVAICHLTKAVSDQLGPHGITVNALHPGIIRSAHLLDLLGAEAKETGKTLAEVEAEYLAETPTRRYIDMAEIGTAVAFLASSAAASITGESLGVDGGITRGIYL